MYLKLEGAEQLRFLDNKSKVSSLETYLAWHAERLLDRGLVGHRTFRPELLRAFVNHGRWLALCAVCGQGMFTHPEWRLACCAECGATYRGVIFPDDLAAITAHLLKRPRRETQNWEPGESAWKLKVENLLHGVH